MNVMGIIIGAIVGSTTGSLIFTKMGLSGGGLVFLTLGLGISLVGLLHCFAKQESPGDSKLVFVGTSLLAIGAIACGLSWLSVLIYFLLGQS